MAGPTIALYAAIPSRGMNIRLTKPFFLRL
jgi:hypothetical protein